ncbi:Mediator of RNA polymerase II transcription subunit 14, partial [Quaeritorhiza haematococci]
MSDVDRKKNILNYSVFTRQQFIKLLVMVRWAKKAKDFQQCTNIHAFIDHQDFCFAKAADDLFRIHQEMRAA